MSAWLECSRDDVSRAVIVSPAQLPVNVTLLFEPAIQAEPPPAQSNVLVWSEPANRTSLSLDAPDRAGRTDQSSVLAACSLPTNHNRARRSVKPAGGLPVAQHRAFSRMQSGLMAQGPLALECHTGKPQPELVELVNQDNHMRVLTCGTAQLHSQPWYRSARRLPT